MRQGQNDFKMFPLQHRNEPAVSANSLRTVPTTVALGLHTKGLVPAPLPRVGEVDIFPMHTLCCDGEPLKPIPSSRKGQLR